MQRRHVSLSLRLNPPPRCSPSRVAAFRLAASLDTDSRSSSSRRAVPSPPGAARRSSLPRTRCPVSCASPSSLSSTFVIVRLADAFCSTHRYLRTQYGPSQPLKGARSASRPSLSTFSSAPSDSSPPSVVGCLHMTIQTCVESLSTFTKGRSNAHVALQQRRPHRDPHRSRCPGHLVVVQRASSLAACAPRHVADALYRPADLLDPGPGRRRHRRDRRPRLRLEGRDRGGVPLVRPLSLSHVVQELRLIHVDPAGASTSRSRPSPTARPPT